jgi:hypothetical protein
MCALIISVVFCSPALAGNSSLSTGQEMIAGGLDDWIIKKCNDALKADMGVEMGNVSELSGVTPMQRLVFAIATYNQNPYKVSWIREEVKTDYIIYVLSGVVLLIFAGIYFYLQIAFPEFTGQATEMVYGYEKFINYSTFSKTLILLIFLPTFLPFLLKYSIELEQAISSGIMMDSLQYIAFSTDNIVLYIVQAISYLGALLFVFLRILIINQTCAKVLIIALVLCIQWDVIRYLAYLVLGHFYSALVMRPVTLRITAMSVKQVSGMEVDQITARIIYAVALLLVLGVCILATLWMLIMVIIKIYTSRSFRKAQKRVVNANIKMTNALT